MLADFGEEICEVGGFKKLGGVRGDCTYCENVEVRSEFVLNKHRAVVGYAAVEDA